MALEKKKFYFSKKPSKIFKKSPKYKTNFVNFF